MLLFRWKIVCILDEMSQLLISQMLKPLNFLSTSLIFCFIKITLLILIFLSLDILSSFLCLFLLKQILLIFRSLPERIFHIMLGSFLGTCVLLRILICVLALSVVNFSAFGFFLFRRYLFDLFRAVSYFPDLLLVSRRMLRRVCVRRVYVLVIQSREKSLHEDRLGFLLLLLSLLICAHFSTLRSLLLAWRLLSLRFFLDLSHFHHLLLLLLESLNFLDLFLFSSKRHLLLFLAGSCIFLHELLLLLFI